MLEWSMAHPWMTFWIVLVALIVIDDIIANFASLINSLVKASLLKSGQFKKLLDLIEEENDD